MSQRSEHQPATEPIEHAPVNSAALQQACAPLVALVLARDGGTQPLCVLPADEEADPILCKGENGQAAPRPLQTHEGKTLIRRMAEMLLECGFAEIEVSVAEELRDDIERELRAAKTALASAALASIAITAYSAEEDRAATLEHAGFELFNLGFGTLRQARDLAARNDADGTLIIPCDLACFEPRHILMLAEAFHAHPDADCMASWAAWLNRPPYLVRRSFLEDLETSPRTKTRAGSPYRPLPHLNVHEVVFGEEMLVAQPAASNPTADFFAGCTLSALEAVRLVRAEQATAAANATAAAAPTATPRDGAPAGAPADASRKAALRAARMNAVYTGVIPANERSDSDNALIDSARAVIEAIDKRKADAYASAECDDLDRWSAWGARNRLDFPLFSQEKLKNKLAYLDSAATSQRVGCALEAQHRFDACENANIYRGAYELSAQSTAAFNRARSVIESHIGAGRRSTVFTANTSASAALVALAWGEHNIKAGDTIVVPLAEHHSNLVPWLMLAQRKGAEMAYIPSLDDGRLDMSAYHDLLGRKPKLVCIAHVSNMLGLVNPVDEMARAAHDAGARVYIDAAQSFPHMSVKVDRMNADFLAFSAHKAYGPMGLGVLWIAPDAFDEMDPLVGGGGTVSHVGTESYYLRSQTVQYELGTPAVSQAIGFAAAVEYLDGLGMDAVHQHAAALTRYLVTSLGAFDGITVWGDHENDDGLSGLVCFNQAGIPANVIAGTFGKLGVAVRSGGHCALPLHASLGLTGSVRFSFGVHTTAEDIEAGLVALEMCRRLHGIPTSLR